MAMYTFIMEYRGGTYISQVEAPSIEIAVVCWAEELNPSEITHLSPALKRQVVDGLKNDQDGVYGPTPLTGIVNAWFINTPLPGGTRTMVNAVKTVGRQPSKGS
jgi:hypothetical protein